jgi:hypothetical protein
MADQSDAPQGMETKNMPSEFHSDPNVVRPAPVPFGDSTHVDRNEGNQAAERDQEVGSKQGAQPTGRTETGGSTTSRGSAKKS